MSRLLEWILPEWVSSRRNDPSHSHGRRFTPCYRKKKDLVRVVWIGSGLKMLAFPVMPFIAVLSLLTTFLSFGILDETA